MMRSGDGPSAAGLSRARIARLLGSHACRQGRPPLRACCAHCITHRTSVRGSRRRRAGRIFRASRRGHVRVQQRERAARRPDRLDRAGDGDHGADRRADLLARRRGGRLARRGVRLLAATPCWRSRSPASSISSGAATAITARPAPWGRTWSARSSSSAWSSRSVLAIWLLGETLTPLRILGIALVVLGPFVTMRGDAEKRTRPVRATDQAESPVRKARNRPAGAVPGQLCRGRDVLAALDARLRHSPILVRYGSQSKDLGVSLAAGVISYGAATLVDAADPAVARAGVRHIAAVERRVRQMVHHFRRDGVPVADVPLPGLRGRAGVGRSRRSSGCRSCSASISAGCSIRSTRCSAASSISAPRSR